MVQNSRNDGTCVSITIRSSRVLPKSYLIVQSYIDDVASVQEVIVDDIELKSGSTEFEKLEDASEKKAPIGQSLNDVIEKKKGKEVEMPLDKIPKPLFDTGTKSTRPF